MQLSEQQFDVVLEFLQERCQNPCPLCGSEDWDVADELYVLLPYGKKDIGQADKYVPLVMIRCTRCGSVQTLDAEIVGLDLAEEE